MPNTWPAYPNGGAPSKAAAVKAYLVTQFTAAFAGLIDPTVEVVYAAVNHEDANALVIVGKTERQVSQLALVGSGALGSRIEHVHVEVVIDVVGGVSESFTAVETDAEAILGVIEGVVRTDPTLGGLVLECFPAESTTESGYTDGEDRPHAVITARLLYSADL